MDFLYGGAFRVGLPEAYERLILDCLLGDATLFTRADEVEEQWALVDAMVAPWKRDRPHFPNYAAGTWGPLAGRRAPAPRRPLLAAALMATSLRELERELAELRDASTGAGGAAAPAASVMTHIAWVPERWVEAATGTLAGLAERHPVAHDPPLPAPGRPARRPRGRGRLPLLRARRPASARSAPR